ncbi:hypothetical protein C0Q70_12502 [Pomacea canaliculata]|uniref:Patched domain-containing protein 3 n=1 Tax=Pomacea canaliculata TaxID=400727 RepID=A0A2T7P1Q8_POMCA|nr:hypothetical protein C0Q70_12502 [Pomacea canaliculata]
MPLASLLLLESSQFLKRVSLKGHMEMNTVKTSATNSDVDNKQQVTVPEDNLSKGKSSLVCKMPHCCTSVKNKIIGAFESYGVLVGKYPLPFIIIPIVVFGGLGFGLFTLSFETDLESLYFPSNSRAINDRQKVRDLFPNVNNINYDSFAQSDAVDEVVLMFQSKNGASIFENSSVDEIREIVAKVKNISANKNGQSVSYNDLCAKAASQCVVEGELLALSRISGIVVGWFNFISTLATPQIKRNS